MTGLAKQREFFLINKILHFNIETLEHNRYLITKRIVQVEKRIIQQRNTFTSPPAASTDPSALKANANCSPTSCSFVNIFSEDFSVKGSLFSGKSHSNHLKKEKDQY